MSAKLFHSLNYITPSGGDPGGTPLSFGTPGGTGTFSLLSSEHWGSGGGSYSVATTGIALNANGIFCFKYNGATNRDVIIGFDSSSTNNPYTSWPGIHCLVFSGTGYYSYLSGSAQTAGAGTTALAGDWPGIRRRDVGTSAIYELVYWRAGIWTALYQFTAFNGINVALSLKVDIESNPGYLDAPRII